MKVALDKGLSYALEMGSFTVKIFIVWGSKEDLDNIYEQEGSIRIFEGSL